MTEEAYYYHVLAEFASLVKMMGVDTVLDDMQQYQEEASNLMRGYYHDH